ncbi:MAG: NAD kinase [Flavobacteriales bacterium]|nr:NAD kinase [Flavobacteriales bacterium]MCB9193070.1 NAD kinase [Flavobacteriales bacterium]
MRIALYARRPDKADLPRITGMLQRMVAIGSEVRLEDGLATWLRKHGAPVDAEVFSGRDGAGGSDLVISLGGDGTFLRAVALASRAGIPVLGINLGRLGFLADIRSEEVDAALGMLISGQYETEERTMLRLEGCSDILDHDDLALNDVSVHKRDRSTMVEVRTYVDDRFLNTYWADGLIIATPTGSTAYSLSCGGPILEPGCQNFVITPIAPHNLNVRPIVVDDASTMRIVVNARRDKYLVNLDARSITLEGQRELVVRKAEQPALIAHLPGHDFFATLRRKLSWGLDLRNGPAGPAPAE